MQELKAARNLALNKIDYQQLNARQKENYNFQKISAILADFGFMTIRLSDDWGGADFIAQHVDGQVLKVQLKGRLTVLKQYQGKDLWICFRDKDAWYLYPHDVVVDELLNKTGIKDTDSWKNAGGYSFPGLSAVTAEILYPYRIN